MSRFPDLNLIAAAVAAALLAAPVSAQGFGLGRAALPDEIAAWDTDVSPDGTGLPPGSGSVTDGEELFAENCAICHGDFAEGVDNWPALAGGMGTLDQEDPVKTVGSFWPYLSITWDYVNRSMPYGDAQTLTTNEVYAVVAYILYSNDLVDEDFVLSRDNFLKVEMPNAGGFIIDDRPETEYPQFSREPCMVDCKGRVEITGRAAALDVTPQDDRSRQIQALVRAGTPQAGGVVGAPVRPDPELVASGAIVFARCKVCHQIGDGATNRTGPVLSGIAGAAAGAREGFRYSMAMRAAGKGGLVWSDAELAAFLAGPETYLKGTRMSFAGLKRENDILAVIAYLKTFPE